MEESETQNIRRPSVKMVYKGHRNSRTMVRAGRRRRRGLAEITISGGKERFDFAGKQSSVSSRELN